MNNVGLHARNVGETNLLRFFNNRTLQHFSTTDTFKTDSGFRKRAIWRLGKNLEFLKSCKDLQVQLENSDVHVETIERLENLALHSTFENSGLDVLTYLCRNLDSLEYALESSRACTPEFRRRYILGNSHVSHVTRTIVGHLQELDDALVERVVDVYLGIACPDVVHLLVKLVEKLACKFSHKVLSYCSKMHALNTNGTAFDGLLNLSRKVVDEALKYKPAACYLDAFIVDLISVTKALEECQEHQNRIPNTCTVLTGRVYDYVFDYVYILEPPTLVHALWGLYSTRLTNDNFYVHVMQALLFKYQHLSFETKSTIYMLLGYLKHMWLIKGGNVACSIFDESSQMLNAKLRRDVEAKIELLSLDDSLNLSMATGLLFRQCKVVRRLMVQKFEMIEWPHDPKLLLKALATCNTLYIGPSYVDVSHKLAIALKETACKFELPDAVQALEYSQHVLARRHTRHLLPLFQVSVSNEDVVPYAGRLIHLYHALGMNREQGIKMGQPPLLHQLYASFMGPIEVEKIPDVWKFEVETNYRLVDDAGNMPTMSDLCMHDLVARAKGVKELDVDLKTTIRILNALFDGVFLKVRTLSNFFPQDALVFLECMQHFRLLHLGLANKCLESLTLKHEAGDLLPEEFRLVVDFVASLNVHAGRDLQLAYPPESNYTTRHVQVQQLQNMARKILGIIENDSANSLVEVNVNVLQKVRVPKSGVRHEKVKEELLSMFPNESILEMQKLGNFIVNFYIPSESLAVLVVPKQWYLMDVNGGILHATRPLAECFKSLSAKGIRLVLVPSGQSKEKT